MEKAIGYLRVSTDGQAGEDKFGIQAQQEAIESFARLNGYEITDWYTDEGFSGATLERPGLQALLSASSERKFNVVLVAKMDRIARDLMAQLWIEKELLTNNAELVSVAEPFRGNDPANVLFRQIIGAFAQFEKARITERMSGGRKQKAKTGGYSGGRAAIGYKASRGSKRLEIDEEKTKVVRRVFDLRQTNPVWTLREIAACLNNEGYLTAQNKPFHAMQVKRILDREELYRGIYQYSTVRAVGQHQAII